MSRVGNNPINIPQDVDIKVGDTTITVKGKNGTLSQKYRSDFDVNMQDNVMIIERPDEKKSSKSLHGLYRKLVLNMIEGVTEGFQKKLVVSGVGFQVNMVGKSLELKVGFSHPIVFTPPEDIKIEVPENLQIKISGADKQKVGEVAARIRSIYPPEPYKGKGIKYEDERVRRKAGKTVGVE
ncbi:MAG: 50S ribosomal protein L6 [Candidatus Marinimicrobia bacterium]|nr:50S ribosomal protein L6 [Candidatus Neomarinimicrobiota bacterium]